MPKVTLESLSYIWEHAEYVVGPQMVRLVIVITTTVKKKLKPPSCMGGINVAGVTRKFPKINRIVGVVE